MSCFLCVGRLAAAKAASQRHAFSRYALAGWYVRLLWDEVLAEWQLDEPLSTLHVHCHVSGPERWLAPPHLRNTIFKREMALVRHDTVPVACIGAWSHAHSACYAALCASRAAGSTLVGPHP